ncbi:hypothetical protein Y032_0150g2776 [Ancylostoma ceylanicum]|uniref:Uncharacterized protein n=1 Tax=Ancylostoma ceylanicum TaxID=53326 RepID=A0A016T1C9_9BILA|nr:hypothetical protein Y032_0150g2776 [Ancylostoma ceylanicum]
MLVSLVLLLLSALTAHAGHANHSIVKRQAKFMCGNDPYKFPSDVPCSVYTLCPNGGVKLFIGCSTNLQCQIHHPESVCIDNCCCTLPRVMETTTYQILYDSATPHNYLTTFWIAFVALLYLAV